MLIGGSSTSILNDYFGTETRTLAISKALKSLFGSEFTEIRNQQVSGSSPLAGLLKIKELRPDVKFGLFCVVPNFVPTTLL